MQLPSSSRTRRVFLLAMLGACHSLDDTSTNEPSVKAADWFTLDAQRTAVATRDAVRKQAYVPNLRAQIAAADWIAYDYHGDIVDANFDPVVLDAQTIDTIQVSMFDRLYPTTGKAAIDKYSKDLAKLFEAAGLNPREQAEARATAIDGLLSVASDAQISSLRWRADVIRGGIASISW